MLADATDWNVIHSYTRADAIRDGMLFDITDLGATDAGFRFPVAVTSSAWWAAIEPTPRALRARQSAEGCLWDMLWVLRDALRRAPVGQKRVPFAVVISEGRNQARKITLHAVIGPGDAGEPVVTVMEPHED